MSSLIPTSRSLNPQAFRRMIHTYGQRVRYWRATPCTCRNPETGDYARSCQYDCQYGFFYSEVDLTQSDNQSDDACASDSTPRAYIYRSKKSVQDAESGLYINVGDTMIQTMPDEIFFEVGDMFLSLDAQIESREVRQRGSGSTDELTQLWVTKIDEVRIGNTVYNKDDYELKVNATTGASSIEWLQNEPSEDANYSVIYKRKPLYWCLGQTYSLPRPSDYGGAPLPITGLLSLKHPSTGG